MSENYTYPVFVPALHYRDPKGALAWLQRAFGFETRMLIEGTDGDDSHIHSEMSFGNGVVFVGGEWTETTKSPKSVGGANTQTIDVKVDGDIDGHCARARAAGAVIVQEPADQFYGERTYRAQDPEGHVWSFHQPVKQMSLDEMATAGGVTIRTSL
jgi:uncharacterized glyoxalase superfamily protein PhnB